MRRIDEHVMRRHELVSNYNAAFGDYPVRLPWQAPDTYSAFHLYVICLQLDQCRKSHSEVFEALRHEGIGVNLHYIPIHTQPYYQALGFAWGDFPIAEQYYREAISLPLYPGLNEQSQVIAAVQKVLS
jgi:dTDP-4-amino-4,6-dideoxygalactose transaminase